MIERALNLPPMPLLREGSGLRAIHLQTVLALLPILVSALFCYGLPALRLMLLSVLAFVLMEALLKTLMGNRQRIGDGHALLNGLLLTLLLPPGLEPIGFFACALLGAFLSLQLFGGLGRAPFHPAIVARLLVLLLLPASRGAEVYLKPLWWQGGSWFRFPESGTQDWAIPAMDRALAALSELAQIALHGDFSGTRDSLSGISQLQEQLQLPIWRDFFWSMDSGTMAAISIVAVLPGAIFLISRRVIDWKVPFVAMVVFALSLSVLNATGFFQLLPFLLVLKSSPLLLLIVFYSADYVHTPMTAKGRSLYGIVLGAVLLVPLILGLPEAGLYLSLPLAGMLVPWIDYWTLPRGPR